MSVKRRPNLANPAPRPDALVFFAKIPQAGRVKTRLLPHLNGQEAAELYHAFVLDSLARLTPAGHITRYVACYPSSADSFFTRLSGRYRVALLDQEGDDLGERMGGVVHRLLGDRHARVVLVGTDSPTLPVRYLEDAFSSLKERPVVLGPSRDGGFYLIGFSRWEHRILEGIAWGTQDVFDQTLHQAEQLGLSCKILPVWYDVDDFRGLQALTADLERDPRLGPHSSALLSKFSVRKGPAASR